MAITRANMYRHYLLKNLRFYGSVDKHWATGISLTGVLPFSVGTNHVICNGLINSFEIFGTFGIPYCSDL